MTLSPLGPYAVAAYNSAIESENLIHDDTVARRIGFTGGLVPGVDVYGYMAHLPVRLWGRAWLEHGTATCRFTKPVYDGDTATVTAAATPAGLDLLVQSRGESCATGQAALQSSLLPPAVDVAPPPPQDRPPADETSLAQGRILGMRPLPVTAAFAEKYLRDLREADPLYASERLLHPGLILRTANWLLTQNVVLGPWIHVGSQVSHFAAAHVGDTLSAHASVAANYVHKGHSFVELDVVVQANATTPIARIAHTAIYRPRQLA